MDGWNSYWKPETGESGQVMDTMANKERDCETGERVIGSRAERSRRVSYGVLQGVWSRNWNGDVLSKVRREPECERDSSRCASSRLRNRGIAGKRGGVAVLFVGLGDRDCIFADRQTAVGKISSGAIDRGIWRANSDSDSSCVHAWIWRLSELGLLRAIELPDRDRGPGVVDRPDAESLQA